MNNELQLQEVTPTSALSPDRAPLPYQEIIANFILRTPPAVVENWKRILYACPDAMTKCIAVRDGVATIANTKILTRFEIPGCPNGFFSLASHDTINTRGPTVITAWRRLNSWCHYCDFDLVDPDFSGVLKHCQPQFFTHRNARIFEAKCEEFRSTGTSVWIGPDAAFNNSVDPFVYPFRVRQTAYDATTLSLAFRETLRWMDADAKAAVHPDDSWMDSKGFFIVREPAVDREMPLVLGFNWRNCILLLPEQNSYHRVH